MSGWRTVLTIGVALAFPFGSTVQAQNYAREGTYAAIGWSFAVEDFEDEIEDQAAALGISVDIDDSFGINGRVGYRMHYRFAVELEFERYDELEFDVDVAGLGKVADGEIEAWSLMANGKWILLPSRFQPYGLVGVGLLDADLSGRGAGISFSAHETVFAWQVGGGVDVYANENWVVNLEGAYVFPTSALEDLNFWTLGIGLQYRF